MENLGACSPGKFLISGILMTYQRKCLGETDYGTATCILCRPFWVVYFYDLWPASWDMRRARAYMCTMLNFTYFLSFVLIIYTNIFLTFTYFSHKNTHFSFRKDRSIRRKSCEKWKTYHTQLLLYYKTLYSLQVRILVEHWKRNMSLLLDGASSFPSAMFQCWTVHVSVFLWHMCIKYAWCST